AFIRDPAPFIPNCANLLRFWHAMDTFDNIWWAKCGALTRGAEWRFNATTARQSAERNGSSYIARVVSNATRSSNLARSWDVLRDADCAALELIGAPTDGAPSAYPMLRLFHFASPRRLPPLPRNYGLLRHA